MDTVLVTGLYEYRISSLSGRVLHKSARCGVGGSVYTLDIVTLCPLAMLQECNLHVSSYIFSYHTMTSIPRETGLSSSHRYISSKGLVSRKQLSQTSFTTLAACTSSLQLGLPATDNAALRLTHSCNCCVTPHCPLVKNSLHHLHSPLNVLALISMQAACRKSNGSSLNRR